MKQELLDVLKIGGNINVNSGAFCQSQYRKGYNADGIGLVGLAGIKKVTYSRVKREGEGERETASMSPSFPSV